MTPSEAAQQAVDIMRQVADQRDQLKRRPDVMNTVRAAALPAGPG